MLAEEERLGSYFVVDRLVEVANSNSVAKAWAKMQLAHRSDEAC